MRDALPARTDLRPRPPWARHRAFLTQEPGRKDPGQNPTSSGPGWNIVRWLEDESELIDPRDCQAILPGPESMDHSVREAEP
jgi:hypothetical protein